MVNSTTFGVLSIKMVRLLMCTYKSEEMGMQRNDFSNVFWKQAAHLERS